MNNKFNQLLSLNSETILISKNKMCKYNGKN